VIICKSEEEILRIREAGRVVALALERLASMVEPGLKTFLLDREAEKFIRGKGAFPTFKGYRGFPASLCVSVNNEVVHGFPSSRRLREGDIVSLDLGATLDGYIADSAVTVPVGTIVPAVAELLEVTKKALAEAILKVRPGNRLGDISHAVEEMANSRRYGIVRDYCGHGVGRELHEPPQVRNFGRPGTGPVVLPGWTIAIEPMLNLGTHEVEVLADGWTVVTADGKPSAHFEHTVAATSNGPLVLTLP